jgi:predicted transcriptional regulator
MSKTMHGFNLGAGGKALANNVMDNRKEAEYRAVVEELEACGLIADKGHKREVFGVTQKGYTVADELRKQGPGGLSDEAKAILVAAGSGNDGHVMEVRHFEGFHIAAGSDVICSSGDDRVVAHFQHALEDLVNKGLLRIEGEGSYQMTRDGYEAADELARAAKLTNPHVPAITNEADMLVHLQGWMQKHHRGTRTTPITFADVDRDLSLPPGSAAKLLERSAEKLGWVADSKGPTVIVFRKSRISSGRPGADTHSYSSKPPPR